MNREARIAGQVTEAWMARIAGKTAKVGDKISIRVPGLEGIMSEVPTVPGKFTIPFEHDSVRRFIDKAMRAHGFGDRIKGNGPYGSDYWENKGKSWRVQDLINDALILEEHLP